MTRPPKSLVLTAFAAIYVIWGSTYLAIKIAIESAPPLLMAGFRFLASGLVVWAVFRLRGPVKLTRKDWKDSLVVGALLLVFGNGGVTYGEQWLASGVTALMIATVPLCIGLLGWASGIASKPTPTVWAGLFLGVTGVGILFNPFAQGLNSSNLAGFISVMIAALTWSAGSLYSKKTASPLPAFLKVALQMICGGLMLIALGGVLGEFKKFSPAAVTHRSLAAFVYLIVFGSWIGFTAYVWLLKVCHPAQVATYAFVNPVVAVFLGWSLAGERLSPRMLAGAAVILASVALVVFGAPRSSAPSDPGRPGPEPGPAEVEAPEVA
jgi:drug/metabolite transporter (DMT)-like permease